MDAMEMVLPVLGIAAAAAVTFYAVSFSEIREKSFENLDEFERENGGEFPSSASSRKTRTRRKAEKEARKREP
ncbi:uncharacterized protein LOC144707606 [Wolffia australiana]